MPQIQFDVMHFVWKMPGINDRTDAISCSSTPVYMLYCA